MTTWQGTVADPKSRAWPPEESQSPESYSHKEIDSAYNFSRLGSRFF